MNKRYILVGFVATLFVTWFFSNTAIAQDETKETSRLEVLTKFTKIIGTVEKNYVDDITINEIINKAIDGLLSNLDAHSSFLNNKKFKELKIQTEGEFGGLGITVAMKDGALTVIAPIEGTPADKAGLKAGDIILKIEDKSTLNMTIDEAVGLMRGKPKTNINLTIVRKNEPKPFEVDIIRDIIKIDSVYAKRVENEDILYLRITSFDKKVVEMLKEQIEEAKPWLKGIVIDLRNNPGGLLDQAVGTVDLFVKDGVIVSQKGKVESENIEYRATKRDTYTKVPIVVLVNGGSASASEIVSGALQDHKRGIVVGEKTFGKGSVQVILPINRDEAIRLTIARYYLPSGRTIQATGVTPDVLVYPGKVPQEDDSFKIKEAELKKHLKEELAKVDGNTTTKEVAEDIEENDDNNKLITNERLINDIQLKSGVDILKVLMITTK